MTTRSIYRVDSLPVMQNRVYDTREEAASCPVGVMDLVQDLETGLIFNRAYAPELLVYDRHYQNEQAVSQIFQKHLEAVAAIMEQFFRDLDVVEIGCGKGHFLELLRARGFRVTGVDPAYEGEAPGVIRAPFSPELGLRAQGIVLRHVLEHIPDPTAFLESVAETNDHAGLVYIEVPCLDWIVRHRAWFDIYYEHANYFRLDDLTALFGSVSAAGHLFGGQYLYVVADLATLRRPRRRPDDLFALPTDFLAAVDCGADVLKARQGRRAAVWGGSSKGVLFTLFMQRRGASLDFVIDINPAKQGQHLAVTGHRVSAPQEALSRMHPDDMVFVMNSNYFDEIKTAAGNNFKYLRVDHDQF